MQALTRIRRPSVALVALLAALVLPSAAQGAEAPQLLDTWAAKVTSTSAQLHLTVNPRGASTSYHFDYIAAAAYEANLAAGNDGFLGARRVPAVDRPAGAGSTPYAAPAEALTSLAPETGYRYRAVARNSVGTVQGQPLLIATHPPAGGPTLLDGRGWELVSPTDKNGGQVDLPEALAGGGVLQAAASGSAITFSSAASFGTSAPGAPLGSQYLSRRSGSGWQTENLTAPLLSGSFGNADLGVPFQIFATDLERALLLNGRHCRSGGLGCPVATPPLPGSGAPPGYQNFYLREGASGAFTALLSSGALAFTAVDSSHLNLNLAASTPDLRHVVLSTCAALTPEATEVPDGAGGCQAGQQNLYRWSNGGLDLVNLLPGQTQGTPGALLAAPGGAISADGSRVYFTQPEDGPLYLYEAGHETREIPETAAGAAFQAASADGSVLFFTVGTTLYRYRVSTGVSESLGGGVTTVLGASADGSRLYFATAAGTFLWQAGSTLPVAAAAPVAGSGPPATGTARVSADGSHLAFLSKTSLGEFDNTDQASGQPDPLLYLYDADADSLTCVSCNPTGGRPIGGSWIPGAIANGSGAGSLRAYKPRALAASGRRLFFNSADALVLADTNAQPDAYEWEAAGVGSCQRAAGCLALLSRGREASSLFVDASADGDDAYFLTAAALVPADLGSLDLYDARVGGGLPVPQPGHECEGDLCQPLPSDPENPGITTMIPGLGNPAVRYHRVGRKAKKAKKRRRHQSRHHHSRHRADRRHPR